MVKQVQIEDSTKTIVKTNKCYKRNRVVSLKSQGLTQECLQILDNRQVINTQIVNGNTYVYSICLSLFPQRIEGQTPNDYYLYYYCVEKFDKNCQRIWLNGNALCNNDVSGLSDVSGFGPTQFQTQDTTGGYFTFNSMWVTEDEKIFLHGYMRRNNLFQNEDRDLPRDFANNLVGQGEQWTNRLFMARLDGSTGEQDWFITNGQSDFKNSSTISTWLNVLPEQGKYNIYLAVVNSTFTTDDFQDPPQPLPDGNNSLVVFKFLDPNQKNNGSYEQAVQKWVKTALSARYLIRIKNKMIEFVKRVNGKKLIYLGGRADERESTPIIDFNGAIVPGSTRGMFLALLEDIGTNAQQIYFKTAGTTDQGSPVNSPFDFVNSITIDTDGNLYAGGYINGWDFTDPNFPFPENPDQLIITDFSGNNITNQFIGSAFITKLDLNGSQKYFKMFGDLTQFNTSNLDDLTLGSRLNLVWDLKINNNRLYITGGIADNEIDTPNRLPRDLAGNILPQLKGKRTNIYIAKTDLEGTQLGFETMGGKGHDLGRNLDFTCKGDVILVGQLDGRSKQIRDFNGKRVPSEGTTDYFVIKLTKKLEQDFLEIIGNTYKDDASRASIGFSGLGVWPFIVKDNKKEFLYLLNAIDTTSGKVPDPSDDGSLFFNSGSNAVYFNKFSFNRKTPIGIALCKTKKDNTTVVAVEGKVNYPSKCLEAGATYYWNGKKGLTKQKTNWIMGTALRCDLLLLNITPA